MTARLALPFAMLCLLVTALAVFTPSIRLVSAQAATPVVVPADECVITPLTDVELVDIAEADVEPVATTSPDAKGAPADEQTIDEIEGLVRQSVACTNANEPMRSFALFTDRYLHERFGGENVDDLGHLLAALTRNPLPAEEEDRLALVSVGDVTLLDTGRVTATVVTANAKTRFTDQLEFARVEEVWRIDRVILGDVEPIG